MTSVRLSPAASVVRAAGIFDAELDGEVIALSPETGECYALSPVASRIWKVIAQPIRVADLCAQLIAEYDVDSVTCETQVVEWLEELRAEGLLRMSER